MNTKRGWEIGTGPSVVVADQGMAKTFSTNTLHSGIYAFTFDQKGLMAGVGIQGGQDRKTLLETKLSLTFA